MALFSLFLRREMTCFAVVWTTWTYDDKCSILSSLCPKRWFQFNSRIIRTHFSSIMTLNNWKMIAETRSYVFRWRSRFRQGRVCLSSLFITLRRRNRTSSSCPPYQASWMHFHTPNHPLLSILRALLSRFLHDFALILCLYRFIRKRWLKLKLKER